jgi:AmiR/NasT family two-component response regulator
VRRVFVIWTNPLFLDFVRLLLRHPAVELVGATSDHAASQSEIDRLRPDAVIVEETDEEESPGEIVSILRSGPMVFRLGLSTNELSAYQRRRWAVGRAEDLLRVLLGGAAEAGAP